MENNNVVEKLKTEFQCKDCNGIFRKKAYTKNLVNLKLCPQCYTKRANEKGVKK